MIKELLLYADLVGLKSRIMRSNWIFISENTNICIKKDKDLIWALWKNEEYAGKKISVGIIHFRRTVTQGRLYKILDGIIKLSTIIDYEIALSFFNNDLAEKAKVFKYGNPPDHKKLNNKSLISLFNDKGNLELEEYQKAKDELNTLKTLVEVQNVSEKDLWELFPNYMYKYWRYITLIIKKNKLKRKTN